MQHLENKEYLNLSNKYNGVKVQYLPPERSGLDGWSMAENEP